MSRHIEQFCNDIVFRFENYCLFTSKWTAAWGSVVLWSSSNNDLMSIGESLVLIGLGVYITVYHPVVPCVHFLCSDGSSSYLHIGAGTDILWRTMIHGFLWEYISVQTFWYIWLGKCFALTLLANPRLAS